MARWWRRPHHPSSTSPNEQLPCMPPPSGIVKACFCWSSPKALSIPIDIDNSIGYGPYRLLLIHHHHLWIQNNVCVGHFNRFHIFLMLDTAWDSRKYYNVELCHTTTTSGMVSRQLLSTHPPILITTHTAVSTTNGTFSLAPVAGRL